MVRMAARTVLFVMVTIIAINSAAERNYKTCKSHEDPSFSACLEEAANIYFANLDEELDGIHHTFKPVKFTINNKPFTAQVELNITKYINTTKSVTVTLKYDAPTKALTGGLKVPHAGYECPIHLDGKLGNVNLQGVGIAIFHLYDVDATFGTKVHIKPGSDKLYEMEDLEFKINKIRKSIIEVVEVTSPTKDLEIALRGVAKNFPDLLFNLAKEVWESNFRMHYEDLTREFLNEILDDGLISK